MRISRTALLAAGFCFTVNTTMLSACFAWQGKPVASKAGNDAQSRQPEKPGAEQKQGIDKVKIESHVRRLNMWPPQIKISVGDPQPSNVQGLLEVGIHADAGHGITLDDKWYISQDGQILLRANVIEVQKDLFQLNLDKLDTSKLPSFGDQNGLVSVVVFSDFQCTFCRSEALSLREKIPATYPKNVRVLFADFPLAELHPWSKPAAVIGRCMFEQKPGKFWEYHDWVFRQQAEFTPENLMPKFLAFANGLNIPTASIEQCVRDERIGKDVDLSVAAGRALRIMSLPTVFVNGRSLENPSWEQLKNAIDYELDYRTKLQEDCGSGCGIPNAASKSN
ncbi:MAG: DsbA family protein [Acidobacteria bacterium]|nr:DsbA family protein [Acidobacteriota bacterium]